MPNESNFGKNIEKVGDEDPAEIEKRVNLAKKKFSQFIIAKTGQISRGNLGFEIVFDRMADNLGLSDLPADTARNIMDKIMSVPGITKTDTHYVVSDPNLLVENFGTGSINKKLIELLSRNPDKIFTYGEIADILGFSNTTVSRIIKVLISEGRVVVTEKEKGSGRSPEKIQFKIVK